MYKSQLFFKDVLWVVAVHTIKTSWKQKNKKNDIWRLFGKALLTKSKKNSRTKKQNFLENVWSEAHVWFFLVLPRFFWFFLVLTLKKLKNSRFFLFFG